MPKPIIYLLLLLTIGACNQKLDPKESIVCELTENALICPKKDITKLPKFEELTPDPRYSKENFYNFEKQKDGSLILNTENDNLLNSFVFILLYQDHYNNDLFTKLQLPLGKCTLHFFLQKARKRTAEEIAKTRLGDDEKEEPEYDLPLITMFCREHFNTILDFIKEHHIPKRKDGYFTDYMTHNTEQYIQTRDNMYVIYSSAQAQGLINVIFK